MNPTEFEKLQAIVYDHHLMDLAKAIDSHGLDGLDFMVQNIRIEVFAKAHRHYKPVMMMSYTELEKMLTAGFVQYASTDSMVEPTDKMRMAVVDLMNYKRLREL